MALWLGALLMHATILPILVVIDTGTLALSCKITWSKVIWFYGSIIWFYFGGNRHCPSKDVMLLLFEEQGSTYPWFNPPLLFVSKTHDRACSQTQNFRTETQQFASVPNEGLQKKPTSQSVEIKKYVRTKLKSYKGK